VLRVGLADGTPFGGEQGVLVPSSKVSGWPEDGLIELQLPSGSTTVDIDPHHGHNGNGNSEDYPT
jgi:hypothetical protein